MNKNDERLTTEILLSSIEAVFISQHAHVARETLGIFALFDSLLELVEEGCVDTVACNTHPRLDPAQDNNKSHWYRKSDPWQIIRRTNKEYIS